MSTRSRPNIVLILTDTQCQFMVGAYGSPEYKTPNLDQFAAGGMRFDNAYTCSPLCTPARSSLFSGMMPSNAGAWGNEMTTQIQVPLMGKVFRDLGYRAAYTGKWHLDGAGYYGAGHAGGGFEQKWWYDGRNYLDEIGEKRFAEIRSSLRSKDKLTELGVKREEMWGNKVANRAIDFLESVSDEEPFLLVASFDEPHGPFLVPPEFADAVDPESLPERANYNASLEGKPKNQAKQAGEFPCQAKWVDYASDRSLHWNCNAYIDQEIGRVIDAVKRLHGENTYIVYTSDHGDMVGSHGLRSKGTMMYEETVNIPFLVQGPGVGVGVSEALVSHLDLMPTFLAWAGAKVTDHLQGKPLQPALQGEEVHGEVLMQFNRFGLYHKGEGGLFPIRCIRDARYKLVINLFDSDELYDLCADPFELNNLILDASHAEARNRLHTRLLEIMEQQNDPFRGDCWYNRSWVTNQVETPHFRHPCSPVPEGLVH